MHEPRYCIAAVLIFCGLIPNLQTAQLVCYRGSISNTTNATLDNPTTLLTSGCVNSSQRTIIYAHGFNGSISGNVSQTMINAYLSVQANGWNIIALDWQQEAAVTVLGVPASYVKAAAQAFNIGSQLGQAIVKLIKATNSTFKSLLHVMGHSLGAQLVGYTGRATIVLGYTLDRITGLDPARESFESPQLSPRLDSSCAVFVDILHTNNGVYGMNTSTGTIDMWPNYNTAGLQPGCPNITSNVQQLTGTCSHNRAVLYWAEAVTNATAFLESSAANYQTWVQQGRSVNNTIYLGEETNRNATGNYYFTTNSQSPFGRGDSGAYYSQ